jgi:hypothetical protein
VSIFTDGFVQPSDRHGVAVKNSLGWAQDCADLGDYIHALGWIRVLEAIGEEIPAAYQTKRQLWNDRLVAANRADGGRP